MLPPDRSGLRGGVRALWTDGDLRAGRDRFEAAYRVAERDGDGAAMAVAALGPGGLWVHEHRTYAAGEQVRHRLRRALGAVAPDTVLAVRVRVRLAAEADYRAGGHAAALDALAEARATGAPVAVAEALSLAHHCLLADAEVAATAYELLGPFAGLPVTASLAVVCLGSVEHCLGMAMLTVGDLDRAVGHLGAAVRANLALGHRPAGPR